MRASPSWRRARPREADERRPLRQGGSECRGAIGRLAVLLAAVALTALPFTASERAPALLLFLLGWGVIKSAEDSVHVRSPSVAPKDPPREPEDPS